MKNGVAELALNAGIVGAGGAGFPTHVKLDVNVRQVIINGAECEPLITVDQMLMLNYPSELVKMAERVRCQLGAGLVSFAVKAKHSEIIAELKKQINSYDYIEVFPLGDFYPAGDEVVTVYEVTGLLIPSGGIPLDVGVVVINVETLWNLYQAQKGIANTHKWVTIAGLVKKPGVYRVPMGITKGWVLQAAGAEFGDDVHYVDGGPMMGSLVKNLNEVVIKTTKALLALPANHPVVVNRAQDMQQMLRIAGAVCCQCRLCTDLCPRNILGYNCEPHLTILHAAYNWSLDGKGMIQALACSECGACDMYSCPMGLSPRRINTMLKEQLKIAEIQNPDKGNIPKASFWRQYRQIPTARLCSRLDVAKYHSPVERKMHEFTPEKVYLPFKQHIGIPAEAIVEVGDKVQVGQPVANVPTGTPMSSRVFSSINGTVTAVDSDGIEITR